MALRRFDLGGSLAVGFGWWAVAFILSGHDLVWSVLVGLAFAIGFGLLTQD